VLTDVTVDIAAGEIIAIVGSTGAGKTTLCEMLVRLADPDSGAVRIGGVDLDEVDPAALRDAVSVVFQETFLFAESIGDNITLGVDFAPADVAEAAHIARADSFVRALPEGYDTVVGERGVKLSGGQRQRVALARALVRRHGSF
jgi:ABC-type multidrug transport system fused ATPase/permease subunit